MKQGLFEGITGSFVDGTPVESVPPAERRMRSVLDHLRRLFNTREGGLPHLSGYGLPDISEIYRSMPDSMEQLRTALERAVSRYEPRLMNVRVTSRTGMTRGLTLTFILSGELRGAGTVRFQTTFVGTGSSAIAPWRGPG
jgi:type VI secretion system protein